MCVHKRSYNVHYLTSEEINNTRGIKALINTSRTFGALVLKKGGHFSVIIDKEMKPNISLYV